MRSLLISLFLLLLVSLNSQANNTLLIITDEWPPYVYMENSVSTGFDYEIAMAVFSRMGYDVDFRIYPWKRCINMIEKEKADAILDIGKNEERLKTMYFPEENISESSSVLFYLKGNNYKFESLKDLSGLIIGTIRGYEYNIDFLGADFFVREPVTSEEQNFIKLKFGRIDMFLVNKNVGLFTAKKLGFLEEVAFLPKAVSSGKNYVAFSKKPGHDKLAVDFSTTLKAFKNTLEFKEILYKYGQ